MKAFAAFENKVAVVTGAGSGIGRALAIQLAHSGAHLALADMNLQALEATRDLLPATTKVSLHQLDVADLTAYKQFVSEVIAKHQKVNLLINNAGIIRLHSMENGDYEDYKASMDVNVWGVLYGCKEFLPYLQAEDKAWMVNISSGAGLIGIKNYTSYNLTKFAVRGFTESLRNELKDSHICVSCVHPGGVSTNIQKSAQVGDEAQESSKKLAAALNQMSAADAAEQLLAGVAKNKARILIGKDIKLLDIIARLFPVWYDRIVASYV